MTEGPVSDFTLLRPAGQTIELSRGGNDLPSRAADNLFWLGRYVQRAEDMVRLLRGILVRLTEKSGLADVPELPTAPAAVDASLRRPRPASSATARKSDSPIPKDELFSLIFQRDRVGSLSYNYRCIHRAAASVRDRISMDMWRILSSLPPEDPVRRRQSADAERCPRSVEPAGSHSRGLRRHRHGKHDRAATAGASSTWAARSSGRFTLSGCYFTPSPPTPLRRGEGRTLEPAPRPGKVRCSKRCWKSPTAR